MFKKPQMQPKRQRNRKITLVFDEEKRREFLGGFRKRKLERKRKAEEHLQKQLKEERKKIKQEVRERYRKSLSSQTVPELEELLSHHEYELENHTVSILEVNLADLKEGDRWIGENKIAKEKEEKENNVKEYSNNSKNDEIVGMSLQKKQENVEQQGLKLDNQPKKSLKELKREIKKTTLQQVKNSKVFKQKQKIEKYKNKKKNRQRLQKAQKLSSKSKNQIKKK